MPVKRSGGGRRRTAREVRRPHPRFRRDDPRHGEPEFEEWRATFRARGHELGLDVWQHALGTLGAYDPCAHLADLTGEAFDHDALRQEVYARHQARCESLSLLPGVVDRVREARAAGLGTGVASSSLSRGWKAGSDRHGIRDLFDAVCTREQVRQVKPAPDLFLLAATRLGVAPEQCVVFEDSPNGIRAARAAGMRCVAIPNAVTCALPMEGADLVLPSLSAQSLPEILGRRAASAARHSRGRPLAADLPWPRSRLISPPPKAPPHTAPGWRFPPRPGRISPAGLLSHSGGVMRVQFVEKASGPERLVCDAEVLFDEDPLAGMKLVGFSLWRGTDGACTSRSRRGRSARVRSASTSITCARWRACPPRSSA